jgi:hypothetical protein
MLRSIPNADLYRTILIKPIRPPMSPTKKNKDTADAGERDVIPDITSFSTVPRPARERIMPIMLTRDAFLICFKPARSFPVAVTVLACSSLTEPNPEAPV